MPCLLHEIDQKIIRSVGRVGRPHGCYFFKKISRMGPATSRTIGPYSPFHPLAGIFWQVVVMTAARSHDLYRSVS
jgi:hypothetical protein